MDQQTSRKIYHLRAFAALWVFIFHYYHFVENSYFFSLDTFNPISILAYHGYYGVSLFFCLSGFLFSRVYINTVELHIIQYYLKRVFRIVPAFLILTYVYILIFNESSRNFYSLPTYIFSTNVNIYPPAIRHLWSINRELQCYALFPLIWLMYKLKGTLTINYIYIFLLIGTIIWGIQSEHRPPYYYGSFLLRFCEFMLGIIVGLRYSTITINKYAFYAIIPVYLIALEIYHNVSWKAPLDYSAGGIIWLSLNSFFCMGFIVLYLLHSPKFPTLFEKTLWGIGNISYSFYLYHFLIINYFVAHKNLLPETSAGKFITLFTLSLFTAFISYEIIEKPGQSIRNRLFSHR